MTQQSSSSPTAAPAESPAACSHHWVIDAATGPSSPGVCRRCGARQEFRNYVEVPYWNEEKARHREQTRQAAAGRAEYDEYADL